MSSSHTEVRSKDCNDCNGTGRVTVTLGCGCCQDSEECLWCNGTGKELLADDEIVDLGSVSKDTK